MLLRSAWIPAPPEGSEPAMDRTAGHIASGERGSVASPVGIRRAGWLQAGQRFEDKGDIPSPVLTGQVQRVWISAGPVRGTPCRSPSLAVRHRQHRKLTALRSVRPGTAHCYADARPAPASGAPGICVPAAAQSSEAGTPTPRMIGALAPAAGRCRRRRAPAPWRRGCARSRPTGRSRDAPRWSRWLRPGHGWHCGYAAAGAGGLLRGVVE